MYSRHEKEDESLRDTSMLSSECNSKADGNEALQEALIDGKLENEQTKDPPDACSSSTSVRLESSVEERGGEMQASSFSSLGDDQHHSPSHLPPGGMGNQDDVSVGDSGNIDRMEDKSSLNGDVPPDISENGSDDLHSSDTIDKDKTTTDLTLEVWFKSSAS